MGRNPSAVRAVRGRRYEMSIGNLSIFIRSAGFPIDISPSLTLALLVTVGISSLAGRSNARKEERAKTRTMKKRSSFPLLVTS